MGYSHIVKLSVEKLFILYKLLTELFLIWPFILDLGFEVGSLLKPVSLNIIIVFTIVMKVLVEVGSLLFWLSTQVLSVDYWLILSVRCLSRLIQTIFNNRIIFLEVKLSLQIGEQTFKLGDTLSLNSVDFFVLSTLTNDWLSVLVEFTFTILSLSKLLLNIADFRINHFNLLLVHFFFILFFNHSFHVGFKLRNDMLLLGYNLIILHFLSFLIL